MCISGNSSFKKLFSRLTFPPQYTKRVVMRRIALSCVIGRRVSLSRKSNHQIQSERRPQTADCVILPGGASASLSRTSRHPFGFVGTSVATFRLKLQVFVISLKNAGQLFKKSFVLFGRISNNYSSFQKNNQINIFQYQ